jgi:hypothetical protein
MVALGSASGRWRSRVISAAIGMTLAGVAAYAATNWVVGLASASNGQGRSAQVSNLTISAVASPTAGPPLYPGGTGDVVLTISNPNSFPVTITAVQLPANTTDASGYTTSALTTAQTGCLATTPSDVSWNFSTPTSGTNHMLSVPLTVGASGAPNDPLAVTLSDDALMGIAAPAACANTYFSMPSLTGLAATGGSAASTPTPATDGWTS